MDEITPRSAGAFLEATLETLRAELLSMSEREFWLTAIVATLTVLASIRVFGKAGFSWPVGLLLSLPPLVLLAPFFLALAPWPARRELSAMRAVQRVVHRAERRRLGA
jgi:hypothetical protein